jgi:hypothetical protein
MRAESEMPARHRWWHRLFARKMGIWRAGAHNEKTNQAAIVDRLVRYCTLCRMEFHEGEEVQKALSLAVGLRPTLTALDGPALPAPTPLPRRGVLREEVTAQQPEGEGDDRPA